MSNLQMLYLNDNSLTLKLSHDWVPPFQLKSLSLASCKIGPHFPKWLQTQNQLISLDVSNNGISDAVPDWFWDLSIELVFLNLSNNQIRGKLPDLSFLRYDDIVIDVSSNHFWGPIPPLPSNSTFLNLSKNKFSGSITFLCSIIKNTWNFFDLSSNLLSGGLPDCWLNFDSLSILNLANNSFSGKIPDSMGFLHNIQTLSLHSNRLTGELPSSLKNCSQLRVLDLRENALYGEIPTWIGGSLQNLNILSLKSNNFHGNIPFQLCHLALIQVLDLSLNNISGNMPKCFNNFSAMTREKSSNPIIGLADKIWILPSYLDNVLLTWKGSEYEYKRKIPLGTQLQSFNASVYAGNLELCGLPLANMCPDEESTPSPGTDDDSNTLEDEDDQFITRGFYVSSILGFFVGFWGVCGTLMLNRSWRHGYYNFLTGSPGDGILSLIFRVLISFLETF
ncbi:hypothetical protein CUMW_265690 [Citrus unshiu]|uniref:Leucine-rich repeat-containing N-terminal plant-type domain-containing protein n=1 Tax=Citrus unshiu TaxID=55188 RepID=A0A2H5QVI9_CITUN|nr:hypothetical protein CUMW_265690 [Citrus unshiu]